MHTPQNRFTTYSLNENSLESSYTLVSGISCVLPLPEVHSFIYSKKKICQGKKTMNQIDIYRCNSSPQKTNRVVFSPFVYFYLGIIIGIILHIIQPLNYCQYCHLRARGKGLGHGLSMTSHVAFLVPKYARL